MGDNRDLASPNWRHSGWRPPAAHPAHHSAPNPAPRATSATPTGRVPFTPSRAETSTCTQKVPSSENASVDHPIAATYAGLDACAKLPGRRTKTPERLEPLVTDGLVDSVLRQLMSGKEATVYVVRCGDDIRCAKVYKEANKRGFHTAVDYTEGRKIKNSRQARAMAKRSRYGRQEQEAAWQSAEVDALHRLAAAGVRVPTPYNFHEGVLLMELVADEDGEPAPRLNDVPQRGRRAGLPRRADPPGGAHAVRRHRPWRPLGVQRAGGCRRPGDHRPAPGRGCRRQQQRQRMLAGTWTTWPTTSASSPRNC
jgi:hypothetical protein